ncbi:MAG TPA: CopG family transcriptional regulator [Thermoanaerobaculia bacterium]|jgi:hypothetical protein|nr:CopG family transcriptional regulator [Thermoanaerobaculia bacterium]
MTRRVTITLDDDVAARMDEEARRKGASIAEVVNETLRHREAEPAKEQRRFEVYARDLGARPDVNFDCVWTLLDDADRGTST